MLDGPLVFVDIDTQRDFLEPGAPLFVPGSDAIRPNLARLTRFARERGIPVLASACAHAPDDPDPEPFPPHCLVDTPGQERIAETAWPGGHVVGPEGRFEGDAPPPHLTIFKRHYDVFSHPDADRIVGLYAGGSPTFVVYGVATDYCVRCAVLGLLRRGHRVAVVTDAVRAVDPTAERPVLREFEREGARLMRSEDVCGGPTAS